VSYFVSPSNLLSTKYRQKCTILAPSKKEGF
jgi:hypothetical protein